MIAPAVEQALIELAEIVRVHAHFDPALSPDIRAASIHLAETEASMTR